MKTDDAGRLHSDTGPCIRYPDGWEIYAVHGIRVPAHVVEQKDAITPTAIDKEENAEVRRVMIEFHGLDRYLLSGTVRDEAGDYKLLAKTVNGGTWRALVMTCPTTRAVYVHPVDPRVSNVEEALAWKRGHDDFTNTIPYRKGLVWEK